MKLVYPQTRIDSKKRVFISFYLNNKRYRLYSGKRIGSPICPNSFPISERLNIGNLLAAELYKFLSNGGTFISNSKDHIEDDVHSDLYYLKKALDRKLNGSYSPKYKSMLMYVFRVFTKELDTPVISKDNIDSFMDNYSNGSSYNTIRRHLNVLFNEAVAQGMDLNPMSSIKSKKSKAILHKPFADVKEVLEDVLSYSKKLHICCLLTYGCLLRPHREVRELKWGDFTNNLSHIRLSGQRNKSGRNRIVPVPLFIQNHLIKNQPHLNIFSNKIEPHNPDFFKTLWSRYKKQSNLIEDNQTLYSFRHTGAINIYERTGSLSKLQQAMGHSSLNVSLTYLRGLEVATLETDDMPNLI